MMGSAEKEVTERILNSGSSRRNGSMGMHYSDLEYLEWLHAVGCAQAGGARLGGGWQVAPSGQRAGG
jgi:hypothetical protein